MISLNFEALRSRKGSLLVVYSRFMSKWWKFHKMKVRTLSNYSMSWSSLEVSDPHLDVRAHRANCPGQGGYSSNAPCFDECHLFKAAFTGESRCILIVHLFIFALILVRMKRFVKFGWLSGSSYTIQLIQASLFFKKIYFYTR